MATLLLSAAGAAVGGGFGGSFLGLSGAVIGRAVGATLGRVIDQKLMGSGSRAVETGKVDRFRLTGASEGAPVGQVWGRMRVGGQVIWASRFLETVTRTGGGKGLPSRPAVTEYSYSVSVAIALCEGEITRVGRIWADGAEISLDEVNVRVYRGGADQLPDPKIEAVEGVGNAPSYRGIAYVVFEDLQLSDFGNRVPQFSFEVVRPAQGGIDETDPDLRSIQGVVVIPGTGEYALATSPVYYANGLGNNAPANINSPSGTTDFLTSFGALEDELPQLQSVSLVVSWFGDDLRANSCALHPKVENAGVDAQSMPWLAGGIARAAAVEVPRIGNRPVYGGTPSDQSVVEAIRAVQAAGKKVVFYPFVLMDQLPGNALTDPWTGALGQPAFPWRGRITLSVAPGQVGSPDRSAAAATEIAALFGSVQVGDFTAQGTTVSYAGPNEWSYRRFVLHYATLCAAAGGVDAFCIGSELRGLTQIRGAGDSFPAVSALRALAADVRVILGPGVKIGYAADWSEYAGYDDGAGNRYFHLDALWADANVDFIGIDNYTPLSDWREGDSHADAGAGSIYDLDYLKSNVAGGEGFAWFYASDADRAAQLRTPITDGAYGEPFVWRAKDIRGWWENRHFDRIGGVRAPVASAWMPRSKPVWFTEFGCPAVDKGTNEPNKFIDPKSSESQLPYASDGRRDDLIQMQYLRAMLGYWGDGAVNPASDVYAGQMVDLSRMHVWAWDARPYPQFPANTALWSDGDNYRLGHWLNGRTSAQPLSRVVAEICERSGLSAYDVSGLYGVVRGYLQADVATARSTLQPLMLAYGFEAVERNGVLRFQMRTGRRQAVIGPDVLAVSDDLAAGVETSRGSEAEIAGRVRLTYIAAEADFEARSVEAIFPDETADTVAQSDFPLALTRAEAQRTVERWLAEARVARDTARFVLPPSQSALGAGDVVVLDHGDMPGLYRIDRMETAGVLTAEAVRIEGAVYVGSDESEERAIPRPFIPAAPVDAVFLDLPLMTGSEVPYAPHLAVVGRPWPGSVAVYSSDADVGYALNRTIAAQSIIGVTETALSGTVAGFYDRGAPLRVRISGALSSVAEAQLLNGANLMAIGDGTAENWELFQFANAVLVADGVYELSQRLRGQAGTEALGANGWPAGSQVVLIDSTVKQIGLTLAERDLARHYRIGPARRAPDDPSYVHKVMAFAGAGLRPYAPAQVVSATQVGGDRKVSWIRRTRIGGDSWSGVDVPLGEASEAYLLRVVKNGTVLREEIVGAPTYTYPAAMAVSDGAAVPFEVQVAQLSDVFGAGPFTGIIVNV